MDLSWKVIAVEKIVLDVPNPAFRIENLLWEEEMFGHIPSMICRFDIVTADYAVKEYLFMEVFHKFLRQDFPEAANKLAKIREYIGGFGSKHRQMVDILTETGFDFERYVRHIVQHYLDIRGTHEEQSTWNFVHPFYETRPLRFAGDDVEDDEDYFATLKENGYRWEFFCEALLEAVIKTSHQFYPGILHTSPEAYKKWQDQIEDKVAEIANINVDYE